MEYIQKPIELEAKIELCESTDELIREVASVVEFPENKTPDVLFFSGIFVSSGENLNAAYFLPSELIKANNTINNKALDMEHEETQVVGHVYSSAFVDRSGNKLDISELKKLQSNELEKMDIDVMIAGIIYKSRFPELATQVKEGKWKLSMETFFTDYDVKIGNVIMTRKEAEALGIASEDMFGKVAKILKKGKEVAKGEIAKVLKNLLFSGCGLVKNPANPRSVILETAKEHKAVLDDDETIIELTVVEKEIAESIVTSPADVTGGPGGYEVRTQTSPSICVSYKRRVLDAAQEGPDTKVIHEDWCTLYDTGCTSPSRGADHPDCLKRKIVQSAKVYAKRKLSDLATQDKRGDLLVKLKSLL